MTIKLYKNVYKKEEGFSEIYENPVIVYFDYSIIDNRFKSLTITIKVNDNYVTLPMIYEKTDGYLEPIYLIEKGLIFDDSGNQLLDAKEIISWLEKESNFEEHIPYIQNEISKLKKEFIENNNFFGVGIFFGIENCKVEVVRGRKYKGLIFKPTKLISIIKKYQRSYYLVSDNGLININNCKLISIE